MSQDTTSAAIALAANPVVIPPGALTIFASPTQLTKTASLDAATGKVVTEGGGRLAQGRFYRVEATTVQQLRDRLLSLSKNEAACWGVSKAGLTEGDVVTQATLAKISKVPIGMVARNEAHFGYAPTQGWLMLDVDNVPEGATLDGLHGILVATAPALAGLPMLGLASASTYVYDAATGEQLRGLTGARFYVPVSDAARIPDLGARLHARLQLAGLDLLDAGVWQGSRLDFITGVVCARGLVQRRPEPLMWNADAPSLLDDTAMPPLTSDELQQVAQRRLKVRGVGAKVDPASVEQDSLRAPSLARLAEVIAATPNDSDHSEYVAMGRAIRGAAGEENEIEGLVIYEEWASRGTDGTGGSHPPNHVWESLRPPHGLGWPYIVGKSQGFINTAPDAFAADLEAAAPAADDLPPFIADFNSRYALIRRMANTVLYTGKTEPEFLPLAHWRLLTAPEKVGRRPVSRLWVSHPARQVFRQVSMDPSRPPHSAIPVAGDLPDFNVWPGFALQPSPEGSCDLFLAHLRDVVCSENEELYQWTLQWLASMVQAPEQLTGTALVLRGEMGSGKSYVGEVIGHILGTSLYSKVAKPEDLTGRFNSHHQGKILLQVEEGFFAGDKSAVGALKHMITSDRVRIELKHRDSYEIPNFARLLITSNEEWVIPAGLSERRFTVIDISGSRKDDWAYHAAMRAQMENGGYAKLMHVLLHTPLDWKFLSRPVNTAALRDQQLESQDAGQRWVSDILHAGSFPDGRVDADTLYELYARFLRDHSAGRRASREAMGRLVRALGAKQEKVRQGPGRQRVYQFPPLAECRSVFSAGLAVPPEWDGPNEWNSSDAALEAVLS